MTSEAGPEALQGLEWWVIAAAPARSPRYHPPGPVDGPAGPLPVPGPAPRLLANKARFNLILSKVSKNDEVSPKYVEKACVSPYIPKRVPEVTSSNSQISISRSLLLQGINGPF